MDEITKDNQQTQAPQAPMLDPIAFKSENTPPPGSMNYAGFWIRLVAFLIDGIIVAISGFIVIGIISAVLTTSSQNIYNRQLPQVGGTQPESNPFGIVLIFFYLVLIVLASSYYVFLTAKNGATLGKVALGLRVVDQNGQNLSLGKAVLREVLGRMVSHAIFDIGYIWIAFDAKKQGFHDKIAGSYVIKTK